MRAFSLLLAAGLLLSACAPRQAGAPPPSDVHLNGVSILGAWDAIGAPDDPDVDRDLRDGTLTRMLVFNPNGRVTLSGNDRRAGTGHVSYRGNVSGNRMTFDELPGTAILRLRDSRTIEVTDPAGNRTVYRRRS